MAINELIVVDKENKSVNTSNQRETYVNVGKFNSSRISKVGEGGSMGESVAAARVVTRC